MPVLVVLALCVGLFSCGDDGGGGEGRDGRGGSSVEEPELRRELLRMMDDDQDERMGRSNEFGDEERADRLQEIVDEFGWPTFDLVGRKGATAAWLIAQHADFDVEFQEQMLDLMRPEVEAGNADASEQAYLVDRVAVNRGELQTYGTQMGCVDGKAVSGSIRDEATVDERRAEVGLQPLAEYLASIDCSEEPSAG
jgi:hypothetical protein